MKLRYSFEKLFTAVTCSLILLGTQNFSFSQKLATTSKGEAELSKSAKDASSFKKDQIRIQEITSSHQLNSAENQFSWNNEPFAVRDGSRELLDKRDRFSKTFANPDGSFSKVQSSEPMHYKDEDGNWVKYDAKLVADDSRENVLKLAGTDLYISLDISTGQTQMNFTQQSGLVFGKNSIVRIINENGDVELYETGTSRNYKRFEKTDKKVVIKDFFKEIDRVQNFEHYKIKTDYIINERPVFNGNAKHMVFEDEYILPKGFKIVKDSEFGEETHLGWEGDLLILDLNNNEIARMYKPVYFDASVDFDSFNSASGVSSVGKVIDNNYKESQNNTVSGAYELTLQSEGVYKIRLVVPVSWLNDENTVYPVVIDPTVSFTYSSGIIPSCLWTGVNSVTKNITIPAGATVTNTASQWQYTAQAGQWRSEVYTRIGGNNATYQWYRCNDNSGGLCNVNPGAGISNIANGVYPTGIVPITIGITRTWGGSGCNSTYSFISNDSWITTLTYTLPPPPCNGTLVDLNMSDTWGDGWNGAEFRLQESNGTIYGPFTLVNGLSGMEQICLPNGCYRVILTAGTFPGEIGWSLTNGATTYASAASPNAAPFNTQFTIGGASCPAPPSNDLCANAPIIDLGVNTNQTHTGTGVGSTNTLGLSQFSESWVRIVVPCGGMNVSMNFCGSTPTRNNAYINLFSDCGPTPTLTQASDWNFTSCSNGSITLNWNNVPAGTYYYPILIDNIAWPGAYSLNIVGTYLITPPTAPTSISGTTTICSGQTTTLSAAGGSNGSGATFQWGTGTIGSNIIAGQTASTLTVSPTATTTYWVRRVGASPCNTATGGVSTTVTVNPSPTVTATASSTTPCLGQEVTLAGNGAGSYSWTNGVTNGQPFIPVATNTYTVTGTSNGCSNTAQVTVTLPSVSNGLAPNNSSVGCLVNQNGWVHFLDNGGRLIASVNSNGQNLGNMVATSYVEATPLIVQSCTNPTPLVATSVMDRHWVITAQNQPSSPVEVRLPFTSGQLSSLSVESFDNPNPDDDVLSANDIVLTKFSGPGFEDNSFTNNCGNGVIDLYTQNGNGNVSSYLSPITDAAYVDFSINSFSEFWLHGSSSNSPLPVKLTAFQANCEEAGYNQVAWETASESNSSHFIVERSRDGETWLASSPIPAAGYSTELKQYAYDDLAAGANFEGYYRLRQVDFNGAEEVYGPISLQCTQLKELFMEVYPNPTKGDFSLRVFSDVKVENAQISICNANGQTIHQQLANLSNGANTLFFEKGELTTGIYFIRIDAEDIKLPPKKLIIH